MKNLPDYYHVPNFEKVFSFDKQHDYCVAIFVIDEGTKLHKQLDRMQNTDINADVIIADGGSNDGSTNKELLINKGVNTLLVKKETGKLGSQMRIAFSWALQRGYKGIVVVDGNNKDSVNNINDFIVHLENGYDHIQGSRFIPGGNAINTPLIRLCALKILHVPLIRLASGYKYTDTTNGFRAYSRKLLESDKMALFRQEFTGYELHYYMAIQAVKENFKCIETPVTRTYPKGKVPTKISPIKGNLSLLKTLISACLGRYNL